MTPAEHYAEAESLAAEAKNHLRQTNVNWIRANSLVALAGVHARLANVDPDVLWPLKENDR